MTVPHEASSRAEHLRERLPRVGLWTSLFADVPAREIPAIVGDLESQGWSTVWIAEARTGREVFSLAQHLLASTQHMTVATGIANMWFREPWTVTKTQQFLSEMSDDRFVLGLGVGHRGVTARSKNEYGRPAETLAHYVAAVDRAHRDDAQRYASRRVLAALGPRMLETAASTSAGAISYLAPVGHTRAARESMGDDAFLAVSVKVVLGHDDAALERARESVVAPLQLKNYTANLVNQGHAEADVLAGAPAVVRDLVAIGGVDDVATRVREHLDAGADHVGLEIVGDRPDDVVRDWRKLRGVNGIG